MNWITLPLLCAALWLTGCASTRLVDSDVQSFSQLAGAPARATYSFERLPSQQAQGAQQSAVEEQARVALAKVGLRESPETKVGELGMGKQQLVEIAKALSKKVDLLILDEPTSSLNEHDSDALLQLLAGSLPGIWLGSHISTKVPDRILRPILATMLVLVGAKLMAH